MTRTGAEVCSKVRATVNFGQLNTAVGGRFFFFLFFPENLRSRTPKGVVAAGRGARCGQSVRETAACLLWKQLSSDT